MKAPQIRQNGNPDVDGAVTRYVSAEVIGKPWYNPARSVIFVNGMGNSSADHQGSANRLSKTLGAKVYGVYNASNRFFGDLWQCVTDKMTLAAAQKPDQRVLVRLSPAHASWAKKFGTGPMLLPPRSDFAAWSDLVEVAYQMQRQLAPSLSKDDYVYTLLGDNRATKSLYALLLAGPAAMLGTPIHAHSQGNLITSNALTGVALARGLGAIRGLEVVSYGSPAQGWPEGLRRSNHAFTFDAVGLLDGTVDFSSSKIGYRRSHGANPLTHAFEYYANHDAEFIVNRFRTGGWGMTVQMDEAGLAAYCASLGNNTERLIRIFQHLQKAHWSDSDDVALAYVGLKSDQELAELHRISAQFPALLISLLEAGWTSAPEREAIDRLRGTKLSA